jgi:hypothetical protein
MSFDENPENARLSLSGEPVLTADGLGADRLCWVVSDSDISNPPVGVRFLVKTAGRSDSHLPFLRHAI